MERTDSRFQIRNQKERRNDDASHVLVKANKDTEAGVMPSENAPGTEMGKFNEELVKAGVMLAGEGLHPAPRVRASVLRSEASRSRRAFRRDQGADCRLLAVAGEVHGRGDRVGQALPQSHRR